MPRGAQRSFRYQKRTAADVQERSQGTGFDTFIKSKFKRYKIKEGKNMIRILPATWENAKHYGLDVWLNYGIGPDNNTFLSLIKHGKGADPIAEARMEAKNDDDEELEKNLRPRQRILLWIIDRLDEDEGPQVMDCPLGLDKSFADVSFDEDTGEIVPLDHPTRGSDVRFYRTGKGLNTKYEGSKIRLMKPGRISEDEEQQEQWLNYITENALPDVLNFYSYDHISQVFNGATKKKRRADDDEEDDDVKPKSKRAAVDDDDDEDDAPPAKKRKVIAKDDDDDDDDAPPPRTKTKSGKKKPSRDDDDDDESDTDSDSDDDADDDDDVRPAKRKRPVADDDDDEDEPKRKSKSKSRDDDDDDDASDDDDEDEAPRKAKTKVKAKAKPSRDDDDEDDEDEEPAPKAKGGGLRDKIKTRKRAAATDDDE